MTDRASSRETESTPDSASASSARGVVAAVGLALAFICFLLAQGAVDRALDHANVDLLLSAIGDGFVGWMAVSYLLVALSSSLATWAMTGRQRKGLNALGERPAKRERNQ